MTNLQELIERVERASGPDREIDALIFRAIGEPLPTQFGPLGIALEWDEDGVSATVPIDDMRVHFTPPAYTASLDAAMMLVPDMWHWSLYDTNGFVGPDRMAVAQLEPENYDTEQLMEGQSITPALALCAASLKARLHTEGEG